MENYSEDKAKRILAICTTTSQSESSVLGNKVHTPGSGRERL